MEKKFKNTKVATYLKRNAYYIIMIVCILAIATMITIAALNNKDSDTPPVDNPSVTEPENEGSNDPTPSEPSDTTPDTFEACLPVLNPTDIGQYCYETPYYWETLNRWTAHMAVDFYSEEATDVVAIEDGVVSKVTTDGYHGTVIQIDHGNNLTSVYMSLSDGVVEVGDEVTKGQTIGKTSTSAGMECEEGNHVHFELRENGFKINPELYLPIDRK